VDELLHEMTAEEFDERFAYYLLSGEGDHRQFAAMLAAVITNQVTRQMAAQAGVPLKEEQIVSPDEFMPEMFRDKKRQRNRIAATDEHAAEKAAKQLGLL
jgi:glycerol-3-phosphate O-acyltransferase